MEITETALRALVREADEQHRDAMVTMPADVADLHATSRAALGRSRRGLLKTAALTGAAVTIGNAVLPMGRLLPAAAAEEELDDPTIAAFAQSIELAAVEAYRIAAASGKITTPAVAAAANVFMAHHQEHAAAFASLAAGKATGKANAKLAKNLSDALSKARDEQGVARIALDTENAASGTYLFALGALQSNDAMRLVASILPVESAHAVTLAQVLGLKIDDDDYLPPFETQQAALTPDLYPLS